MILVDIPVEPLRLATADNPTGSGTIVVNASVTFNVIRPYIRRSANVSDNSSEIAAQKPPVLKAEQGPATFPHHDPFSLDLQRPITPSREEGTSDDRSDGSIVVVKAATYNEDADGVKRRWFREEMRQSPVLPPPLFI